MDCMSFLALWILVHSANETTGKLRAGEEHSRLVYGSAVSAFHLLRSLAPVMWPSSIVIALLELH